MSGRSPGHPAAPKIMLLLRSLVFTALLFVSALLYSLAVTLCAPFPFRVGFRIAVNWSRLVLRLLALVCRLDFRVEGRDNIPDEPCVVLLKHQSAWETIAQICVFPHQCWVLKHELMLVPFLGWGLAVLKPIAINRSAPATAMEQVIGQGRERLAQGLCVMIFPEGTRIAPGKSGRYGLGGAALACAVGCKVLPVAHNAGYFWPRRGWLKRPGTITLAIGPPLDPSGGDAQELTSQAREWIETKAAELAPRSQNTD